MGFLQYINFTLILVHLPNQVSLLKRLLQRKTLCHQTQAKPQIFTRYLGGFVKELYKQNYQILAVSLLQATYLMFTKKMIIINLITQIFILMKVYHLLFAYMPTLYHPNTKYIPCMKSL